MNAFQIKALLLVSAAAVEAGIVRIYQGQTEDEKVGEGRTVHSNGRGFNHHHARYGSYMAKWVLAGNHLTGHHLVAARKMCVFYIRQLVEESEERLAHNTVRFGGSYTLTDLDPFQNQDHTLSHLRQFCALRPEWRGVA